MTAQAFLTNSFDKAVELAKETVGTDRYPHPDITTVACLEGKKEIVVDQIRDVVRDSVVLPNQSERKAYIISGNMNDSAQNAALKLLEEPPVNVVVILCAEKLDSFLPTIRSRCIEYNCNIAPSASGELAASFLTAFAKGKKSRIEWLESNNTMSIAEAAAFSAECCNEIADMLTGRKPRHGIDGSVLLSLEELFEKILTYLNANVNVKQVFGLLEIFDD